MRKVPSKTEGMHSVCLCSCKAAVELVLVALAHHHLATGNDARAFSYLLERAAAYLHVSSKYLAFLNLNKAEVLRNSGAKKGNVLGYFEEATFLSLKGELAEEVFSRCSRSPVFYPRVYHLKAYVLPALGNEEESLLCLKQGLQVCEDSGNLLEKTWLEMSSESGSCVPWSCFLGQGSACRSRSLLEKSMM
ncbi:adenylate cyclase type 10-like isoform X3 [Struthio camelus]|uniref:adenylate cyclase type 10-like isoform X3 n=1 Tax=Struthio camelus TaxID=8801 RepID=UPI0036042AD5